MTATSDAATSTADREIVISRDYDAPRELVFDAWTDARHLSKWWGPNGFTTTTHEIDVRPGGVWRFIMHGPDGRDYQNQITYLEVVKPEGLVYKHGGSEENIEDVSFSSTVRFEDLGGKTRVTLRMVFASTQERDRVVKKYGAIEGGKQTLARLAEYVAESMSPSDCEIASARVFNAPPERVFQAFSNPNELKHWWGPTGFTNTIQEFDLRPGGAWRLVMHGPDGTDYHNESVFTEVVTPERVVFEHREPIHRFRMTMTFLKQGDKTRLTWCMRFESKEEFEKVRGFIATANEQNFDRLGEHLETM